MLSVGYKHNVISDFFEDDYSGMAISYVIEDTPLGTGGGIRKAMEQCTDEHVFVINMVTPFLTVIYQYLVAMSLQVFDYYEYQLSQALLLFLHPLRP